MWLYILVYWKKVRLLEGSRLITISGIHSSIEEHFASFVDNASFLSAFSPSDSVIISQKVNIDITPTPLKLKRHRHKKRFVSCLKPIESWWFIRLTLGENIFRLGLEEIFFFAKRFRQQLFCVFMLKRLPFRNLKNIFGVPFSNQRAGINV